MKPPPSPPHGLRPGKAAHHARRLEVHWNSAGFEPSLEGLLHDPVLLALLARNGITVEQLRELCVNTGERLRRRHAEAPHG